MKIRIVVIFACLFSLGTSCQTTNKNMNTTTVKELDLPRYLGTWYEIARFDHRFERGLQGVTATYSMRDDGKIKVLKRGYDTSKLIWVKQKSM